MTTELKMLAGMGAIMAALTAAPALAQGSATWDTNDDAVVDQQEFQAGFDARDAFNEWDADGNGSISAQEFEKGFTTAFDGDETGDLNQDEQTVFSDSRWGRSDGVWDADDSGNLDKAEFEDGIFGLYDEDDSGDWSDEEYAAYQEEDEGWFNW